MKVLKIVFILLMSFAVSGQVKLTQVERSSQKWDIPVAKRTIPGIPNYSQSYMSFVDLIDSLNIELGSATDTALIRDIVSDSISTLTKSDVGLGNVDNTSDANKPISTASQTALNAKVDKVAGERLINAAEITKLGNQSGVNTGDQNDHGLMTGLLDDDHTQYMLLSGRVGGQTLIGGTAASDNLTLSSTSIATKGSIIFGDSRYNESTNRFSLGTATGTGRINLPDGGTTASDGIAFGIEHSIYRNSSNVLIVNSGNILRLTTAGSQRLYIDGTQVISLTPFSITPPSLTGSSATSALSLSQTWNTTGSPTAIFANITNTASGASANLMDLQVGGVSRFRVDKEGNVYSNLGEYRGGASTNFAFGMINGGFSGYFRIKQNYDWNGQPGTWMFDRTSTNGNTATSGNGAYVLVAGHFKPSSGTATYSSLGITDVINQTGGANGITRGLFINPTLTAAADWRGAEFVTPSNTVIIGRNVGSAAFDVQSTTQGFLPPRMTATQASAIASPSEGLMIYVTNTNGTFTVKGWYGYNGAAWERLNN